MRNISLPSVQPYDSTLEALATRVDAVFQTLSRRLRNRGRRVVELADGETTPSAAGRDVLKTNNTTPTTITEITGGEDGQTIRLIFQDANTSVDFSSANMIGNSGSTLNAKDDEFMVCTYDEDNDVWYCDVVNT